LGPTSLPLIHAWRFSMTSMTDFLVVDRSLIPWHGWGPLLDKMLSL
jgi:hypothetical protein